jgi:pteridine reductase
MDLQGKTVLVTGAAKRVGREIAKGFAKKGAHLLIHYYHSKKEAEELARELRENRVSAKIYSANLLNLTELQNMTDKILRGVGTVDVLVNNASLFYPTPFETTTEEQWNQFMDIHLKAPFFLSQAFAPGMKKKGEGRIIHISDWSGLRPYKEYLPYCTSKGALLPLTQGLAKVLAPEILVNAVFPGPILPSPDFTDEEKQKIAKKTLLNRWGTPEDIVRTVLFLAESDFVTGCTYHVDGGESLIS